MARVREMNVAPARKYNNIVAQWSCRAVGNGNSGRGVDRQCSSRSHGRVVIRRRSSSTSRTTTLTVICGRIAISP